MTAPGIHASALPNDLPPDRLRHRADGDGHVAVDPGTAGWRYLSYETVTLSGADSVEIGGPDRETAVVLQSGGDAVVTEAAGERHVLEGRTSVFDGLPSAYYLPAGKTATIHAATDGPTTLAISSAPARPEVSAGLRSVLIRPSDIKVEIRGAGRSTRQINHVIAPDFPADRLLVVEVLTPAGNWSSWPPHKHDTDDMPDEAVLEEIYHYRFRRPEAWAIQRIYRAAGSPLGAPRDALWAVRDGDVVVVTDGYHPFVATDADDAYYLNALTGDRRTMACSFDPALDEVRARWAGEALDPRVPLVGGAA
ncbi:MAG TPA: 5-deoxy-glucuronate isomerase [Candidatus Limnocylindrales bacterium]